ncbi:MAG: lipid-A-disaccharide synthase [Alphaproteobacteria bacterium]|nr:MAG: lipid-A-disaccharide synthase [Alphaproteobacteria bacterium]
MQYKKTIFIIAGEISGDQLGGILLRKLKTSNNSMHFYGIGGKNLLELGLKPIFSMEKISLMGLIEVLPKIPELLSLIKLTVNKIIDIKPDLIITIDAPGFNFRILKKLKQLNVNIPNIHIVAPTVWAWKANRAKKIASYVDNLFVLYPFEKKYFIPHGIKTYFIGHPLVETINKSKNILNKRKKKYISIFPGSRKNEINFHLDLILNSLLEYNAKFTFVIVAVESQLSLVENISEKYKNKLEIDIVLNTHKEIIFNKSFLAIAVSGTITLELALHKVPFITVYKLNFLSYFLLKNIVFAKYITLVNIIFDKPIVPELIQSQFNQDNIRNKLNFLIKDEKGSKLQLKKFGNLENMLKNKNVKPSVYATKIIKNILNLN